MRANGMHNLGVQALFYSLCTETTYYEGFHDTYYDNLQNTYSSDSFGYSDLECRYEHRSENIFCTSINQQSDEQAQRVQSLVPPYH